MLQIIHQIFIAIHVPAGLTALLFFYLPAFTKKGGSLHVRSGRIYYLAMWIVLGSAAILSVNNVLLGNFSASLFLGFLTIITSYPLWYSKAILKEDRNISLRYFKIRRAFNILTFIFSIFLLSIVYSLKDNSFGIILGFFGILGLGSFKEIRQNYKTVQEISKYRTFEHLKGTMITGIAAHTAFLAFGGRKWFMELLSGYWYAMVWIAPTIVGVVVINLLKKKYGPGKTSISISDPLR